MKTSGLSLDQAPPEDILYRFFISALVFGIAAGTLITLNGNALFQTTWHPATMALTHLITLGWLAMIMIGAIYQIVPVLVGKKVPAIGLSWIVHILIIPAIISLTTGFFYYNIFLFYIAFGLLISAFTIFIGQVSLAIFSIKSKLPVVTAMRISIFSLLVTVIIGIILLGFYTGWWSLPIDRVNLKFIHLTWGFFGWISCLIIGVSFHVIPMFYLTDPFLENKANWILRGIFTSLLIVSVFQIIGTGFIWIIAGSLPGIIAIVLYVFIILRMINNRKRKIKDTTLFYWKKGLFLMPVSVAVFIGHQFLPTEKILLLLGFLFLIGFAMSITTGMLYKIVPFLVWFHRYSDRAGQPGIPMLKDILADRNAKKQIILFTAMSVFMFAGLISGIDFIIRIAGALLIISSFTLLANIFKAIRSKEIPA